MKDTAETSPRRVPGVRATLVLSFVTGLTSLVYEVIATKTLFFFYVENTYSVGIVLATFLAGLACGALIFGRLHEKVSPWTIVFVSQLLAGIYAIVEFANFGWLPVVLDALEKAMPNTWTFVALKMIICSIHVGVPAILMGVVFPLVLARGADAGGGVAARGISWIYALDLAGSAIGALLAGVVALPLLGLRTTVHAAALANFAVAGWAATARRFWAGIAVAAVAVAASTYLLAMSAAGPSATGDGEGPAWFDPDSWVFFNVIDRRNSPYGVITVGEKEGLGRIMYVNYRVLCVENSNDSEYEMGAVVGLVFEERDRNAKRKVLSVGLGCGYTLEALAGSPNLDPIDVVEINPVVIDMAREHFAESTGNVFSDPKVRIIEDDGYHFLRQSHQTWDSIVIDIEEPAAIHSSPLYTKEFYATAAKRLEKDGVLAVWAYRGNEEYCKVLLDTLRTSFPHVLIRSNIDVNLVYFASRSPMPEILQTPLEIAFQERVEHNPSKALNTLGNQVLQRLFKPREYYFLPDWYQDPWNPDLER